VLRIRVDVDAVAVMGHSRAIADAGVGDVLELPCAVDELGRGAIALELESQSIVVAHARILPGRRTARTGPPGPLPRRLERGGPMKRLEEQAVLVTGATDGLGRGVATELARDGATVLVHGRSP